MNKSHLKQNWNEAQNGVSEETRLFERARANPRDVKTWIELAVYLRRQQKLDVALSVLTEAKKHNGKSDFFAYQYARFLFFSGHDTEAESALSPILQRLKSKNRPIETFGRSQGLMAMRSIALFAAASPEGNALLEHLYKHNMSCTTFTAIRAMTTQLHKDPQRRYSLRQRPQEPIPHSRDYATAKPWGLGFEAPR